MGQWQHQVPHVTWRELTEQGEAFTEENYIPARFEDAMLSECEVIHMWYDRINRAQTYVTFNRDKYPNV